jgi:hypothetical protein
MLVIRQEHMDRNAGRIVLHSHKAKMLSRVELKDDPEGAVKLQQAFTLRSLGTPEIDAPPEIPMFDNKDLGEHGERGPLLHTRERLGGTAAAWQQELRDLR